MTSSGPSRLRAAAAALFLTAGSLLFACTPLEPPGASEAATAQDVSNLCEAMCGRHERCAGEPASTCTPACEERYGKAAPRLRADLLQALGSCLPELECDAGEDGCNERAQGNVGIDPVQAEKAPDFVACQARQKQCEGTNFGFSAEECSTLFFMTSSSRAKPAACYEKADPCETLKPKPADCDPKVCKEARECIAPYEL
jgi:hypothetical protein